MKEAELGQGQIGALAGDGPEALGPEALGPEALGPEALGPEALGPEALGPEALGAEMLGQEQGQFPEAEAHSMVAPMGAGPRSEEPEPREWRASLPDEAEIQRIVSEPDPILRNLLITRAYGRLSAGLAEAIDPQNLNWSTFATWASLTAGQSIRSEEVPRFFLELPDIERRMADHLGPRKHWFLKKLRMLGWLQRALASTLSEVSTQVADGNRKVFEELAPLFLRFVLLLRAGHGDRALEEFCGELKPGSVEQGGQDLLREAFTGYARAAQHTSEKERAELILLANCRIGLHEQTRLQPNIEGALNAPIEEPFERYLKRERPWLIGVLLQHAILWISPRLLEEVKRFWQEVATRYFMNLSLPNGKEIPLGGDVPPLPTEEPPALQTLDNPDLRALFIKYRGSTETHVPIGTRNWALIADRMWFIVELFRSRQQHYKLFEQPFEGADERELEAGRVPKHLVTGSFGQPLHLPGRKVRPSGIVAVAE